jgi:predicted anti-sigma-YlaC factor YlaD
MAIPMRPLSCAEAREEAARRAFEPLEPHVEATLSAHLAACTDCRNNAEDLQHTALLLRSSLLVTEPPLELEGHVFQAIRSVGRQRRRSRRRLTTAFAASVLSIAGLALIALPGPSQGRGRSATLAPTDRVAPATGSVTIEGPGTSHELHLNVTGLPDLADGSTYALWAGDGKGSWTLLGEFRTTTTEALYQLPRGAPELVRVTIERIGAPPDTPGLEVLTGRLSSG